VEVRKLLGERLLGIRGGGRKGKNKLDSSRGSVPTET
jgi:hypothetical protein